MWAAVAKALLLLWRSKLVRAQAMNIAMQASRRVMADEEGPASRAMAVRAQRRLAEALAHQIDGAKISYGTVIGGRRHFVVWLDDKPVQVFPADIPGDLAAVPELEHFNRGLLHDPPSTPPRLWHRGWWLPPGEPRLWEAEFWGKPRGEDGERGGSR
jgi:hypothetical protein